MSAQALIQDLAERDIHLAVSGSGLRYRAPRGVMTPELRATLKAHKQEIMAALVGATEAAAGASEAAKPADWGAEDWQALYDERAGLAEHDGGLSRPEAEVQAFRLCVLRWLRVHPVEAGPGGTCAWCSEPAAGGGEVILLGLSGDGPAWAHSGCHQLLTAQRLGEAADALAELIEPVGFTSQTTDILPTKMSTPS